MVNVMGQTPEDAMRILQERIDEAQRQAQGARDFVEALQKARITGHDSRSEIEVEVNYRTICTYHILSLTGGSY